MGRGGEGEEEHETQSDLDFHKSTETENGHHLEEMDF